MAHNYDDAIDSKRDPARETARPGSIAAPRFRAIDTVRHRLSDGDLILFRRRGLIAIAGRGLHSHAGMVAWWSGCLMLIEATFPRARAITLDAAVARYPARLDVFRANPAGRHAFDRRGAVDAMRRLCGRAYSLAGLLRVACYHLTGFRFLLRPGTDDTRNGAGPMICSQAIAWSTRTGGGVDPVPNLEDRSTEPADLARSTFYQYEFTLTQ